MRVAIVTGSASGIGAASALELARRGWRVVVNYSKSAEAVAWLLEAGAQFTGQILYVDGGTHVATPRRA